MGLQGHSAVQRSTPLLSPLERNRITGSLITVQLRSLLLVFQVTALMQADFALISARTIVVPDLKTSVLVLCRGVLAIPCHPLKQFR